MMKHHTIPQTGIDAATDFSLSGYLALLSAFRQRGYHFADYHDLAPQSPHLILRHDVDFSLDCAVQIGALEASLGVKAWYFILMRSEFYNPHTPRNQAHVQDLLRQGHRIGLHFDAGIYGNDPAQFDRAVAGECRRLEELTALPVTMVSFHRPAKSLLNYTAPLAGRLHSYMPQFFSAIGYCSDSRGCWPKEHPLDHPAVKTKTALQLLTHPLWWCLPGADAAEKLTHWSHNQSRYFQEELARHCSAYQPSAVTNAA